MKTYFYNKNYIAIYLHGIFDDFARSIIQIFGVIFLYKIGLPIWSILLFYAFQFGLMGFLSPLSPILISKIGLVYSILISNIFRIIGTSVLLIIPEFSWGSLCIIGVAFAIDGAIYHPLINGIVANYIRNEHRGRFNSLHTIFKSISVILSVLIGGYLVSSGNNIILIGIITTLFIISNCIYLYGLEKIPNTYHYHFKDVFKYLYSQKFRENIVPFSFQAFFILERIFIPLFIFILVADFQILSYIVGFALAIELIILLFFGKRIDKYAHKSFFQATFFKSITSLFFIFFHSHIGLLFFNQTYAKITENMFKNSFYTLLQKKAKKEDDPILFTTAKEMTLCFTDLFLLSIFAGLAYFIGNTIFMIIFASSFIALWITYKSWKD